MILRIDPRRPLVWRTPYSLQIGIDPVAAVLTEVTDGDAQVVAALSLGVTQGGLDLVARTAGVPQTRLAELLTLLGPALAPAPMRRTRRIAVIGSVAAAGRVARVLAESGHPVIAAASGVGIRHDDIDQAVLVSHHVIDPTEHLRWLRNDITHLAVVIGEGAATVGPVVEPGATACLACIEQQRTALDPAWPAIGAQLHGTVSEADTPLLATEATVEALRLLDAGTTNAGSTDSVRIDAATGARTRRQWQPSDRCGCRGLELSVAV